MKVRDLMDTELVTIPLGTTYAEVLRILNESNISGAPVVDESGALVGLVSEKDLFRILYPFYQSYYMHPEQYTDHEEREKKAADIRNHKVEVFMSKMVYTVHPDVPVMRAGALMLSKKIHRLPVVEGKDLVGIISRRAIYKSIMESNYGRFGDA
jgi:predicted transcriptional regulator